MYNYNKNLVKMIKNYEGTFTEEELEKLFTILDLPDHAELAKAKSPTVARFFGRWDMELQLMEAVDLFYSYLENKHGEFTNKTITEDELEELLYRNNLPLSLIEELHDQRYIRNFYNTWYEGYGRDVRKHKCELRYGPTEKGYTVSKSRDMQRWLKGWR